MKKLLILILFLSNLYGQYYIQNYIAEDHTNFKEAFYEEYKNKQLKEFTIKFKIDLEKVQNKTNYLTIISDKSSLVFANIKYEIINDIIVVKLDKNQNNELLFKYIYDHPKRVEFRWNSISDFEYTYLLKYEGILYGVSYGIIFCAFLYYIIIYFSTKMRCFLYYSLMQFFVLLSLIGFVYFSYLPYPTSTAQAIVDICETLSFLFTLLFAQSILNTKEEMPKMHNFINLFILLNILDVIAIFFYKYSILYNYLPFYIGFLVPTFAGFIAILKGDKYAIIYTIGWLVVSIFIYIAEDWQITPISGIYVIHIGAPFESLIFSFALGYMLKILVNEKNEKEKLLIHQSKLASMGEMINNIAHQWRQPLTHLGFINMNLQLAYEDNPIDKKYLKEKIIESNAQLDFMSKTIDNFSDFYLLNKQKELFLISNAVKKALDIMEPIFENNKIEFKFNVIKDKQINAYENEFSQVILNLLTNAKDILLSRNIENPQITITIDEKNDLSVTSIFDNAGGIENKYQNKIFEPYFTTKQKGSGIGLYMSKMIIQSHFKGKIKVLNTNKGACFSIEV
ncbi:7TMR-DISM-7TM domain-containing two-component system sensor histidine kinase [Arcobacter venerupis]|uniref:histidine kinase n=1 Tax=Arcobacter venerupis TaxID=1054033 RepID=A0AAE7E2X3_9BACT|nr:sensor histidine kinase [Arcobacter venerupis]QKF66175.1 7TMR-DISM-7TM domain-containing two-component system sensor histidine kinase [Arcobacter venerupis]RWS51191.1 histidine kinase [Arcobacter venerupis]